MRYSLDWYAKDVAHVLAREMIYYLKRLRELHFKVNVRYSLD